MRVFTDSEICSLLHPAEVVDAIEAAFAREYRATAVMPVRTHVEVAGRGVFLVMPCYDSAVPGLGTKLVTVFDDAAERLQATYVLLDPATGKMRALMAANYLTDVRTAATSAVATRHMAREAARVLGVFGTGRQARSHIEVMSAVRRFDRVLVCGSSAERSRTFAAAMAKELDLAIKPADARSCASQSDVICTCTTSSSPVLEGKWLRPGTHLNLVGAFQPDKREVDSETMRRARIVVETYESALAEAGDLLIPMSEGVIGREHVIADLHEVTSGKKAGRTSADEITVFKNLGCALEDLVTATLVCQNAERRARA
ncbi:MAG TPA: ornithine cyclodeaminase family protein [Terriglobales bacterium]|nr:ornithine cyclodeaminase family protein [Terriglobales bacterium]